jgi:Spy/CpxP family protein refolding chaperone
MVRQIAWAFAALLLVPAESGAYGWCDWAQAAQRGGQPTSQPAHDRDRDRDPDHKPPPKWWIDPQLRAELAITDAQSAAVEDVWQKSLPKLRDGRGLLEKQEDVLSQMIATDAAETAVVAQIERVENMRADLAKGRTLMIYRMNKVLTPDQRARVKAMMEKRESNRRGPSAR